MRKISACLLRRLASSPPHPPTTLPRAVQTLAAGHLPQHGGPLARRHYPLKGGPDDPAGDFGIVAERGL